MPLGEKTKLLWQNPEYREQQRLAHIGLYVKEKHPMWGKHHSEESKKKISESGRGRHFVSEEERIKTGNRFRGIKLSEEQRMNGSLAKLGDKNPRWQGGSMSWMGRQVLKRDDYTCQKCGLRDPEIMEIDHIKPQREFPQLKCSMDNLWILCPNCHRRKTNQEATQRSLNKKMKNTKINRTCLDEKSLDEAEESEVNNEKLL